MFVSVRVVCGMQEDCIIVSSDSKSVSQHPTVFVSHFSASKKIKLS